MKLSEEAQELRNLLDRFFAETVTSEYRRKRVESGVSKDADFDSKLSELALFEYFSDPNFSRSVECVSAVSYCIGKYLVPSPLTERLLTECVLPAIAGSELDIPKGKQIALVYPRCCALSVTGSVRKRISGSITWGLNLGDAEYIVAFVGAENQAVLISREAKGVTVERTSSLDLTASIHSVELKNVEYRSLSLESSIELLEILYCCKAAEIAGACQRVMEMTLEYVKTRKQFNRPIGSFQAIQQALATAHVDVESLVSLSGFASWAADNSPEQKSLTSQAAIIAACSIGPRVCEVAIQSHGGIGFTWEYDLHLYLRRIQMIASAFGLTSDSAERLIQTASSA